MCGERNRAVKREEGIGKKGAFSHDGGVTPSRLPARVLRPSGARPGPTEVATETGRWATCHRHVAAPIGGAETCLPRWGRCHRGAMTEGVAALVVLSPLPPPTSFVSGGNWLTVVGGGFLFLLIISFSKGAGLACRLGRRWTVATGDHRPPLYPPRGRAHPARRMSLSCREFRKSETRPSKSSNARLGSCAHPRKGPLSPGLLQKRGFKGGWSRLPPRSAMDGRHWRPSPPFEMRCIEYSPPPVQKSYPPFLIPLTGGGRGWGEMGYPPVAPMA